MAGPSNSVIRELVVVVGGRLTVRHARRDRLFQRHPRRHEHPLDADEAFLHLARIGRAQTAYRALLVFRSGQESTAKSSALDLVGLLLALSRRIPFCTWQLFRRARLLLAEIRQRFGGRDEFEILCPGSSERAGQMMSRSKAGSFTLSRR